MKRALVLLAIASLAQASVRGENWNGWRGPRGDGTSRETQVPVQWDGETSKNIVWKVEVPGSGIASPIVWGERIFLVSCIEEKKDRVLICLDREAGKKLWQKTVFNAPLETLHHLNSRASSTPATNGKSVFVSFLEVDGRMIPAPNVGSPREITPGVMVIASYDFDGKRAVEGQTGRVHQRAWLLQQPGTP